MLVVRIFYPLRMKLSTSEMNFAKTKHCLSIFTTNKDKKRFLSNNYKNHIMAVCIVNRKYVL